MSLGYITLSPTSMAGGASTIATVDAGGSVIVSQSQLVHADGRTDPFPCNGTLPTCVELHAGPVEVVGPAVVTLASPLVCDTLTGECLSDLCAVVNCGAHGTCSGGTCTCVDGYGGDFCEVALPCCSLNDGRSYGNGCNDCSGYGSNGCCNTDWCFANYPGWSNGLCDPSC